MKADLSSGRRRLRQDPPPSFPPDLRFPLLFLQKPSLPTAGLPDCRAPRGAGQALSAVLTARPSPRRRLQQRPLRPALRRRPFYGLSRTRRDGQWRRISLGFFLLWGRGAGGAQRVKPATGPPGREGAPPPPAGLLRSARLPAAAGVSVCTRAPLQVAICAEVPKSVICAHYEFSDPGTPRETF